LKPRASLKTLAEIYWLRIIIDEGHIMGSETSNQARIASQLVAERYWACSGTPTPQSVVNYSPDNELKVNNKQLYY
jgi:SNF2 family DNA or RNA helicase